MSESAMSFLSAVLGDKRYSEMLEDPDFQKHAKKGDVTMCEVLDKAEQRGKKEGAIEMLCSLVYQGVISLAIGVTKSNLSEPDFLGWMHKLYPDYKI